MNSSNPIIIDNKIYDKLTINLAISTNYNNNMNDMNMALRATPTCLTNEGVSTLDGAAHTLYKGSLSELQNEVESDCVSSIINAIQNLITSKGW